MKKDIINKFLGKYCKIITKESYEEKTHASNGVISDFNEDEASSVINSPWDLFYLKVDTIL